MDTEEGTYRVLSSGRKVETGSSSINRMLKSGRRLGDNEPVQKRQRTLYSQIGTILHENDQTHHHHHHHHHHHQQQQQQELSSQIHVSERKPRENQPSKKLLLQAVSDANKSVLMKLNKSSGVVKVMKPDGTTECLTTRTLAKRLKAKEPTWIDPSSLLHKTEPSLSKMKICVRNEYCSNEQTDEQKINESNSASMDFADDDEEDEFVVVVNSDDDINNIWMLNDYPYDENVNEFDEGKGNGSFKRKLSDDMMSDDNDEQGYSPASNQAATSGKKLKRCRFWPDCHNGDQCEFVHPTQRCTHFPNCIYGAECLYIHPSCRFAGACTRSDCPYLHSTATPASSPNDNTVGNTTRLATRPESSTVCKYGVQCMRPNCMYSHPRIPFPLARNYKWINNKWRASDDTPLLPPIPKTMNLENPFIPEKSSTHLDTNSNNDSIEK